MLPAFEKQVSVFPANFNWINFYLKKKWSADGVLLRYPGTGHWFIFYLLSSKKKHTAIDSFKHI